jgi:uncharacterized lipoprotein YddW (UPF0748 family)
MRRLLLAAVLLTGCAEAPGVEVVFGGAPADVPADDDPADGDDDDDDDAGPALVDVAHRRELRGAWVATVYGINWPTNPQAPAADKQAELEELITTLAARGVNAVFFQVRPESDALYASDLEPWSRFLTGVQGRDPGFDPLQVAIDTAHANNVELHAWLNPYRGLASSTTVAADNHVTRTLAAAAVDYDGMVWMDPSSSSVRAHVVDVVEDIVDRYDVDGIHFDDYFYPYPAGDGGFPDAVAYAGYTAAGGSANKSQWRRDNVNALIGDVSAAIADARPAVRFGVSPFGIYRDGVPEGIHGLDAYEDISCDPVTWLDNDWVDYLAPQLYWPTTQTAQAFGKLLPWWSSLTDGDGRFVVAGLNLAALGSDEDWSVDEYRAEIDIVRNHDDEGARGAILYHADPLLTDQDGVGGVFADELWSTPALLPPVVADTAVPPPPEVTVRGGSIDVAAVAGARAVVVYRDEAGEFVIDRIAAATTSTLALAPGRWAVSVAGKNDRESRAVVVTVTDP